MNEGTTSTKVDRAQSICILIQKSGHSRCCQRYNVVSSIFHQAIKCIPTMLICDTTWKTNKYHLPLLEIVV